MILKRIIKDLIIGIIFTSLLIHEISAQNKTITHENQQWLQYYNESKLNNNWTLLADASFRWKDEFNETSQFIVRAGLGYAIKPNLKVAGGIAYSGYYSQDSLHRVEYRPHQELQFKSAYNKIKFNQRLRIEERFFNTLNSPNNTFNFRFRYSFMASFPIFQLSKNNPDSKFLLNISNEIFINAGKDIVNNVFDQNRITISPVFQLNRSLSISPTYTNQFSTTTTAGNYRQTNVFWLQIRHHLEFE